MSRKPRLHVPGALYHVILRGNAGQDIFLDDEDRHRFFGLLDEVIQRFDIRVHAFCLMSNHVHMAVQMAKWPLSKPLQIVTFRYTRYFNRKHRRIGHLFQGRYKALLVDGQSYLLELVRYIHLNPVRAGLTSDPVQYPYSGHLEYMGITRFGCLTTDWVLSQFGEEVSVARRRYETFVMEGIGQGHLARFHRGAEDARVLGADRFLARVLDAAGEADRRRPPTIDAIVTYVCKNIGVDEDDMRMRAKGRREAYARALVGWLANRTGSAPLAEVARRFRRDLSGISRAVAALERTAQETAGEGRVLRRHLNAISQA